MPRCHISLGGNAGPVAEHFTAALDNFQNSVDCSVVAVSHFHETTPVGDMAGGRFLNAAAELETSHDPIALLDLLQSVEGDLGRIRTVRWGPRPIDLDLLFYDLRVIDSPRLVVPHPAAWYRRFVLDPLVEIAPDLVHPVKQASLRALRDRLLVRPLPIALAGGAAAPKREYIEALINTFSDAQFVDWDMPPSEFRDPALIFWLGIPGGSSDSDHKSYERLPPLSRLDPRTAAESPLDSMRHAVQSALGL
jgi:2-amino-4-hydroxy-6-hydroxymethyldihydropteridine diphosphokinase